MRLNKRIILIIGIAVAAVLGASLLLGQMSNREQAAQEKLEYYSKDHFTVAVAAVDLPAGKPITSDCVKEEESRTEPKPGTLDSYALAVGRIPIHAIPTGRRIHEEDLVPLKK